MSIAGEGFFLTLPSFFDRAERNRRDWLPYFRVIARSVENATWQSPGTIDGFWCSCNR